MELNEFLTHVRQVQPEATDAVHLFGIPSRDSTELWQTYLAGASVNYLTQPILQVTRGEELVGKAEGQLPNTSLRLTLKEVMPIPLGEGVFNYVITFEDAFGDFKRIRDELELTEPAVPHAIVVFGYNYNRVARTSMLGLTQALHGKEFVFDKLVVDAYDLACLGDLEKPGVLL